MKYDYSNRRVHTAQGAYKSKFAESFLTVKAKMAQIASDCSYMA